MEEIVRHGWIVTLPLFLLAMDAFRSLRRVFHGKNLWLENLPHRLILIHYMRKTSYGAALGFSLFTVSVLGFLLALSVIANL